MAEYFNFIFLHWQHAQGWAAVFWLTVLLSSLTFRYSWHKRQRKWRRHSVHCRNCSYNLCGTTSMSCPECGHALNAPRNIRLRWPERGRRWSVVAAYVLILISGYSISGYAGRWVVPHSFVVVDTALFRPPAGNDEYIMDFDAQREFYMSPLWFVYVGISEPEEIDCLPIIRNYGDIHSNHIIPFDSLFFYTETGGVRGAMGTFSTTEAFCEYFHQQVAKQYGFSLDDVTQIFSIVLDQPFYRVNNNSTDNLRSTDTEQLRSRVYSTVWSYTPRGDLFTDHFPEGAFQCNARGLQFGNRLFLLGYLIYTLVAIYRCRRQANVARLRLHSRWMRRVTRTTV